MTRLMSGRTNVTVTLAPSVSAKLAEREMIGRAYSTACTHVPEGQGATDLADDIERLLLWAYQQGARDAAASTGALRDAVEFAHANGFEWPSDPMPKTSQNWGLSSATEALIDVAVNAAADLHSVAETMPDSQLREERRRRVTRIFDSIRAVRQEASA